MTDHAPSTVRAILRELPRGRVAVVVLVVLANLFHVVGLRGHAVAAARSPQWERGLHDLGDPDFVPPWSWTADEWHDTVWPWR